ncbi:MAG: cysteine peptidase family C39 domain-containing protein [Planctomycetota bacterium]|jgi:hypothetical protein
MELLYYLLLALISATSYGLGRWVGGRGRNAAILGYFALVALLLVKAVLNHNPDWEFGLFPWPDYVFFQSYGVFPLALGCLGLASGLLPPGPNRRAVLILAGFVFLVSLWTERWVVMEPDTSSISTADADHHCLQTTIYSCGPAACVSLLSCWGIEATEGEMMGLCATPAYGGTSLFRICRGLRLKLPRAYEVKIVDGDPDRLRELGVPAIISVRKVHVITLYWSEAGPIVLDPAHSGPERISMEKVRERYGGPAVVVLRDDEAHVHRHEPVPDRARQGG